MTKHEILSAISDAYETCQQYVGCAGCPKCGICYELFDHLNLDLIILSIAQKCSRINNVEEE